MTWEWRECPRCRKSIYSPPTGDVGPHQRTLFRGFGVDCRSEKVFEIDLTHRGWWTEVSEANVKRLREPEE